MILRMRALLEDHDLRELFKGTGETLALKGGGMILSYVFAVLLARICGPSGLGLFTVALAIIGVVTVFATLGFGQAGVRFAAADLAASRTTWVWWRYVKAVRWLALVGMLAAAILTVMAPMLAQRFFPRIHGLQRAIEIAAWGIPFATVTELNAAYFQGRRWVGHSSALRSLLPQMFNVLSLLLLLPLLFHSEMLPIWTYVVAVAALGISSTWRWCASIQADWREVDSTTPAMSSMLRVAVPMMFATSLIFIMDWTDILMLGAFRNASEVGIYRVASRLAFLVALPLVAAHSIILPKLAEFHELADRSRLVRFARTSSAILAVFGGSIALVIILAPGVFLGLFGLEFRHGVPPLIVLVAAQLFNTLCGTTGPLLTMTGHEKLYSSILLGGAAVNIAANMYLIPRFGITGAAVATGASIVLINTASALAIRRRLGFWIVGLLPSLGRSAVANI